MILLSLQKRKYITLITLEGGVMRQKVCITRALSIVLLSLALFSTPLATPCHAWMLISEVLVNATGDDDGKTFVELAGTPGVSLSGYSIVGINGADGATYFTANLSGFTIGADGIFVAADLSINSTSDVYADAYFLALDPQNGPDSIQLREGSMVIDAIGYGDFTSAIFAGEGTAASVPSAGYSLARHYANIDTNNNATDFEQLDVPSPGIATFNGTSPVPIPAGIWLLGSGLIGLVGMRRHKK
jgi:hypothetical protein